MYTFQDYLYKYGLHDCVVDSATIENNALALVFHSGVYRLNPVGKEINLTESCKVIFEIEELTLESAWEHIDIKQTYRRKVTDIEVCDFFKLVQKFKWDIDMNFYSYFCNTVLLKGYISKCNVEMLISEVQKIEFLF